MGSRVPIPGCLIFFTAVWRVFHTTFDLLLDLIFRLAHTLRSFAHGVVCLQTLTALVSLVHPNIIALRFNDDVLSTIPPVVVWTLARLPCNHLDPLHILGLQPGPPEILDRHTLEVVNPLDLHADVRRHCGVWVHTVR